MADMVLVMDDEAVIEEITRRGDYETMMAQVERVKDKLKARAVYECWYSDATIFYTYYFNHPRPEDNGWQMVVLPACPDPDLVTMVHEIVTAGRDGPIIPLYRGGNQN